MLVNCTIENRQETVCRLVSASRNPAHVTLLQRGVNPSSLEDTLSVIAGMDMPLVVEEIVEYAFKGRKNKDKPFGEGRFGNGTIGVYYSALEDETCESEIAFHVEEEVQELRYEQFPYSRHYSLVDCQYSGSTADLRGKESQYPELISETKSGYPFCQRLGLQAVENGIAGFFSPSARHMGGTCVPVFERTALSKPMIRKAVTLRVTDEGLEFEPKPELG